MQPANASQRRRIEREKRTIRAMIAIHCRGHHAGAGDRPCPKCVELLDYAVSRLDRCPFGGLKPACAKCPIHCYKPAIRERVRAAMRYAGPRMLFRHPILALWHQFDSLQPPPQREKKPE
jgi:hypothetical protein